MTNKALLIALTTFVAVAATSYDARGEIYSTNFDALAGGSSLTGQDGWDTNNYSDNGTPADPLDDLGISDSVGILPGYSSSSSDNWAVLGGAAGFAPVVNTSYLFRTASLAGSTSAAFNVDFGIISSQSPNTNRDTFGWTFRDSSENQLLRVGFIPDQNQPTNLIVHVYDSANAELPGSGGIDIFYDAKYHLEVAISSLGAVSVSLTDSLNVTTPIVDNQLAAGALPGFFNDAAATWTVADTTANGQGERVNYGSNSLAFDNYALTPEPASTALLLSGFASIAGWRRRRS